VVTQFSQVMALVMLWLEIKMFESSVLLGAEMATRVSLVVLLSSKEEEGLILLTGS